MKKYSDKIAVIDFKDYIIRTQIAANTKHHISLWHIFQPVSNTSQYLIEVTIEKELITKTVYTLPDAIDVYNSYIEEI